MPFVVKGLFDCTHCPICGAFFAEDSATNEAGNAVPLSWLKRIPPLSELDDVKQDKEISA